MIHFRKEILENFEANQTLEKRIQRYMLMGDEVGIQVALYLLLILSDDHKQLLNINDVLNQTMDTQAAINKRNESVISSPHSPG